jgi:hypothetical protein
MANRKLAQSGWGVRGSQGESSRDEKDDSKHPRFERPVLLLAIPGARSSDTNAGWKSWPKRYRRLRVPPTREGFWPCLAAWGAIWRWYRESACDAT